jgi:acetylglutamate kinase
MGANFKLLRAAAPYVATHRGKLFVVKAGGELLEPEAGRDHLVEQLGLLHSFGIRIVLVHGGGPQIASVCARLGLAEEKVNGRRITSPAVLEAVTLALPGALQTALLAAMHRQGLPAVGLSGLAAGLVQAARRGPVVQAFDGTPQTVDYGEVGDITAIDPGVVAHLSAGGYLPVVAPLGCTAGGEVLNINADTVAAALAVALGAQKLVFLMQPAGILGRRDDPASLLSELRLSQLAALEADGTLSAGMLPKAAAAAAALRGGVPRVHFVSGANPDALLQEIFTNEGSGTMVVPDA